MIRRRIGTDLFISLTVMTTEGTPVDFTEAKAMSVVVYNSLQKTVLL